MSGLLKHGLDINLVFNKDQTVLSILLLQVLNDISYTQKSFNKLEFLLQNGADINLGNLRFITDLQYRMKPVKIEFIKYLIKHGLDISNKVLYDNKMLYDTNLGTIIQMFNSKCNTCFMKDNEKEFESFTINSNITLILNDYYSF